MLLQFSLKNFRSFRDEVTLSMMSARLKGANPELDRRALIPLPDGNAALKTAAFYGPNAGGKSNLLMAFSWMVDLVRHSFNTVKPGDNFDLDPFRFDRVSLDLPTRMEVVFISEGIQYRYGFEVSRTHVDKEWLFQLDGDSRRERRLFEREAQAIKTGKNFPEGTSRSQFIRENALFLTLCANLDGTLSKQIVNWFRKSVAALTSYRGWVEEVTEDFTSRCLSEEKLASLRPRVETLLSQADLGIAGFVVEMVKLSETVPHDLPRELKDLIFKDAPEMVPRVFAQHHLRSRDPNTEEDTHPLVRFPLVEESHGTQRLYRLAGPIVDCLDRGMTLIIDEMDSRFHPLLTEAIVELFHSPETNPHNAQLIFTTHDVGLMESTRFRRDQVWFVEKDQTGASHLYSLAEFRGVRNDESFVRAYLRGKYGATPILNRFGVLHGQ